MPQLDKVAFLSQFFWLCVFYLGFYYVALKIFLPKISRVLALRKRKITLSHSSHGGVEHEHQQVRQHFDSVVARAFTTSRQAFQGFFSSTTGWVAATTSRVNQQQYQQVNASYIQSLGDTSVSHNMALHHASHLVPQRLAVKLVLDKLKTVHSKPATSRA